MSFILSIESAVNGFSVAAHRRGELLSTVKLFNERVASSLLTSAIEQVLKFSEITLTQLDAIAVSSGPGSYTGLRVGISTAKGLCLGLDLPLIDVNTLELMAHGVNIPQKENKQDAHLLCPLIDARRMEVYCGIYDGQTRENIEVVSAKVIDEFTFADLIKKKNVVFFGNGAAKIEGLYAHHPNAFFLPGVILPAAENMGMISHKKFTNAEFVNLISFEPDYLKPYFATKPKNQLSPQ